MCVCVSQRSPVGVCLLWVCVYVRVTGAGLFGGG